MNSKFAYGKVENLLKIYGGEDYIEVFCYYISNEAHRHMSPKKPMKHQTCEQWRKFKKATTCHISLKEFKYDDIKVRDHCHYTRRYQGPAHRTCNLRYKIPNP